MFEGMLIKNLNHQLSKQFYFGSAIGSIECNLTYIKLINENSLIKNPQKIKIKFFTK